MNLQIDPETLTPVIQRVVIEVLAQLEAKREQFSDRLAYSEQEAARLLGLEWNQLRDERYRGRIRASQIVGRRVRYTRQDLMTYLSEREWKPK